MESSRNCKIMKLNFIYIYIYIMIYHYIYQHISWNKTRGNENKILIYIYVLLVNYQMGKPVNRAN